MISGLMVRDLNQADLPLIVNYWLQSTPDYLESLGVDLKKLPSRSGLLSMLQKQLNSNDNEKDSLALIAVFEGVPIGHCNVNKIIFGEEAYLHLHLWNAQSRKQGLGTGMVLMSVPLFFSRLKLKTLWCEPYALNPAPNKTLEKIGFKWIKRHLTVPGSLNFEQEVNLWKLSYNRFTTLYESND